MPPKRRALPTAIVDLSEFTESQNWLVYGDSGIGKTVLIGQLPNCLILACEPGTVSAARRGSSAKVWPCKTWQELEAAYAWLESHPDHGFTWVAVDSAKAMQTIGMRMILQEEYAKNPAKRHPDVPQIQDHLRMQLMFKRIVMDMNALPVNVCWTAIAMMKEDHEGDDIVLPAIQGKDYEVAQWFCAEQAVVAYYGMEKTGKKGSQLTERYLLLQKDDPYFAKNRYDTRNKDGDVVERITLSRGDKVSATFDKIVHAVYEYRVAEEE